jgi:hypothetical protein
MAETHQPPAASEHADLHHEESDVNFGGILAFGAGLIVVCMAASLIVFVLFKYFEAHEAHSVPVEYPLAAGQGNRVPPEPRLQVNPREDLRELRAKEDELLGSYGWVDKNAGIVRIPIDDAMKLTIERGLPARTEQGR